MNKEELEKKLTKNGWNEIIEKDNGRMGYSLHIGSKNSDVFFRSYSRVFANGISINAKGRKKIKKDDFFSIINYLKEKRTGKPFIFNMRKENMTNSWNDLLESYFEKEKYRNLHTLNSEIKQMIYMGSKSKEKYYTTKEDLKEIEDYAYYLLEIEKVAKEHETEALFFYSYEKEYVRTSDHFFFSIEDYQCFISLKIENKLLKLCVKKDSSPRGLLKEWAIDKKEDIKKYLQEYMDQIEKKQRVRNLYQMSNFFFKHYCVKNDIFEFENVRDELLQYYTTKEMEEISINFLKDKKRKEVIKNAVEELCFFDDKAIHFSYKTGELKLILDQEEINQHIKEIEKNIS